MPTIFRILLMTTMFLTGCVSYQGGYSSENQPTVSPSSASVATPPLNPIANDNANNNTNASLPSPAHHVALLLPLQGNLSSAGTAVRDGFMAANTQGHNIQVDVYDTSQASSIIELYTRAQNQGADFIIGPLSKTNVSTLEQSSLPVPTLALNFTDENRSLPSNLFEFGLSPLDEARDVADRAAKDGYHSALLIVPTGAWGKSVSSALTQEWVQNNGQIVDSISLSNNDSNLSNQIKSLLHADSKSDNRRQDMDVIFLIADPSQARLIKPLLKYYYAGDVPIYATSMVYSGVSDPSEDNDLNGITFCDLPWMLDKDGVWSQQRSEMGNASSDNSRLYAFGGDAYRLSQQLAQVGNTPTAGIPGATGTLYMMQQRIHRQLSFAQFRDGVAMPLS